MGIPVVYREYNRTIASYIGQTLQSLIKPLTDDEKELIQFILILADESRDRREYCLQKILHSFNKEVESGLINIIAIPTRYYLQLHNLPSTYNDGVSRMYWRSKQALDYAYTFNYVSNLCEYYIQHEDDVIARKNYFKIILKDIKIFNSNQNKTVRKNIWDGEPLYTQPWLISIYYRSGFIGRLIPSKYLPLFSTFIRWTYNQLPVDLTISYLFQKFAYREECPVELFTHIGKQSSSLGT